MPGCALSKSDPQRAGFTVCHASRPRRCLIYLLKNTSCIFQDQFSARAFFPSAKKAKKKLKPNPLSKILDLARERGWTDPTPLCAPPLVLTLPNRHEIA